MHWGITARAADTEILGKGAIGRVCLSRERREIRLWRPSVTGRFWTRAAFCGDGIAPSIDTLDAAHAAACRGAGDARMGRTLGPRSDSECSGSEREKQKVRSMEE